MVGLDCSIAQLFDCLPVLRKKTGLIVIDILLKYRPSPQARGSARRFGKVIVVNFS